MTKRMNNLLNWDFMLYFNARWARNLQIPRDISEEILSPPIVPFDR